MASFSPRLLLTKPIYKWAKKALPTMSETEQEAMEAGYVWWDAELFAGNPDWDKFLKIPKEKLTRKEQAFLNGPVDKLCAMVDDWKVNWEDADLSAEAWDYMKKKKFFGMIIPEKYGGLEFSAYAHSEVVRKISTRSISAAVTVMVPNSLGPGELIMQFGTEAQKNYWLPRLARGEEVPCFGLTSPEAGSDAAAMIDTGVVCEGTWKGKKTLGIRLNWHKRYITLGPVATVLGLAFKMYDPDHLLGTQEELGITVALVPTDLKGIEIGDRHIAAFQMFQNGPNRGKNVFIPLDFIIGGKKEAGKGWKMLMSALAAGRGISLPSLSAAGAALSARTTGAYARVREQFNIPIGKFEGVQEALARIAANAYLIDAGRTLTCAGLRKKKKLAVISGIMKAHATDRMRDTITDAMDVHGGKTVIDGPKNYLGGIYRAVPVAITVEGANILTRNLIIFGQGAIRCHPWLLKEMKALEEADEKKALRAFDKAFWSHVGHALKTLGRALGRTWTRARFAPAPKGRSALSHYRRLSRFSAGFALSADMAFLTLGGALKRKELLSARFGDILSELFLLSAALKRFVEEGEKEEDRLLLDYVMAAGFCRIERAFAEIFANFPNPFIRGLLKFAVLPRGNRCTGPPDKLVTATAQILLKPSAARDRLTAGLYLPKGREEPLVQLEQALDLVIQAAPVEKKLRKAGFDDWREKGAGKHLSAREKNLLKKMDAAIDRVIAVDSFEASYLPRKKGGRRK